jgi:hypothetical protein
MNYDRQKITENFRKTTELVQKYVTDRLVPVTEMLNDLQDRYATAPASTRTDYFSAFPGGLCLHNLTVFGELYDLAGRKAPGKFTNETLLIVSLLHDLGKIGDAEEDYYIPLNSDWHKQRGINYEINPNLQYAKVAHRSLFLAQRYGIPLTQDEYLAILLSNGQNDEANASYKYQEPELALLLGMAKAWATKLQKNVK